MKTNGNGRKDKKKEDRLMENEKSGELTRSHGQGSKKVRSEIEDDDDWTDQKEEKGSELKKKKRESSLA